jgi:hypothetical protein
MNETFHDPADSIHASYTRHPVDILEPLESPEEKPSPLAERIAGRLWNNDLTQAEMASIIHGETRSLRPLSDYASKLRELIVRLIESKDPVLECKALAMAVGIPIAEESMSHVGTVHGVGRAAVSKRTRIIQDQYGIKSSGYSKAASSRDEYRKRNVRRRKKGNPQLTTSVE